jgi:hypothetical protein
VKRFASLIIAGALAAPASTAAAEPSGAQAAARSAAAARNAAEQRYQIGQMERVLEGAVEHGVTITRDRLQSLAQAPADMLVSDNAHARGFRLEGYGVFFDVIVPSFDATLTWSLRTLDQNDLGLQSALRTLQSHVRTAGDPNLEQALKRLELQMPTVVARTATVQDAQGARNATGSAASADPDRPVSADDPILSDPNEAYRSEVTLALKDAMLTHSSSLNIGPGEWLAIAAKGNSDRPRLAPADTESRTRLFRIKGSDLADFLAGKITRDEALQRIEVREF